MLRFLLRGRPGFPKASPGLVVAPTVSSRVYISSRQKVACYATNPSSDNSESSPTPDEPFPSSVTNGTNGNDAIIPEALGDGSSTDWSKSYYGLSSQPFAKDIAEILEKPLDPADIEMKPGAWAS